MVSVLLLVAELETEELDGVTFALDSASVSLEDVAVAELDGVSISLEDVVVAELDGSSTSFEDDVVAELDGASISFDDDVVAELERFSAELGSAEPETSELEEPCVGQSA